MLSFFFKDIGVPDSQTVNSSSMAFHKFKTKPPFHSSTLKTYYSKNVFVECSVFEFLASYFHFIRLFKLNKFSISVTVLLLSVHPSVCMSVPPSIQFAGCVQQQFLPLVWFGHDVVFSPQYVAYNDIKLKK